MSKLMGKYLPWMALSLSLAACSNSNDASPEKKTVTRVNIPDNEFKPVALENTISDLIEEIGKTDARSLQLGVVLKNLTGYWEPVKIGANRAIGELQVSGVVVAPSQGTEDENLAEQIDILQKQQQDGYDGYGVAPLADSVTDEINTMVDSGRPVVTLDSDQVNSERQLYLGTINHEAGAQAAQTLVDLLKGGGGTVIILGHDDEPSWPDGYNRSMGAKGILEKAGYTVNLHKTNWNDGGEQLDVDFMKDALLNSDPPAVGMLSMFSPTYRCAEAAEAASLTGDDITIVGFDFEPQTVSYMRSGLVKATHAQRQYYMGYMTPYVLYSLNVLGLDKTRDIMAGQMVDDHRFNAGLDVVPADKLDEYNSFLDSLGIGG